MMDESGYQETPVAAEARRSHFKFENCVLSSDPQISPPGLNEIIFEAEEFCIMETLQIAEMKILLGIKADVVKSQKIIDNLNDLQQSALVEVKNYGSRNLKFYKLPNWWCQSFIGGVNKIVVGIEDNNFNVREITNFQTKNLPIGAKWHHNVCKNFLKTFLEKVESDLAFTDESNTTFRYICDPKKCDKIQLEIRKNDPEIFFSAEFLNFMEKL